MSRAKPSCPPGFEQAHRLERDAILELELEKAGVTAFVGLEAHEATALEPAAVNDKADAFGRLEAKVEQEVAEGAGGLARAALPRFELQPDVVDRGEQRAEPQAEPRAGRYDDLGRAGDGLGRDEEPVDCGRAELDMRRHLGLEPRLAVEAQAVFRRPLHAEAELEAMRPRAENFAQEPVAVGEGQDQGEVRRGAATGLGGIQGDNEFRVASGAFQLEPRGKREEGEVRAFGVAERDPRLRRVGLDRDAALDRGRRGVERRFHAVGADVDAESAVGREAAGHRHRHVALVVEHVGRGRAADHRRHREADRLRRAAVAFWRDRQHDQPGFDDRLEVGACNLEHRDLERPDRARSVVTRVVIQQMEVFAGADLVRDDAGVFEQQLERVEETPVAKRAAVPAVHLGEQAGRV
jgi:hypothetical protein